MTTYAAVYFNGEFLCITNHTGYPNHLGESLEGTKSDWRSILSICEYYGIYYINAKFFLMDSNFVYNFLDKDQKKKLLEEYPDVLKSLLLRELQKHKTYKNKITIKLNINEFFEKYGDFGLNYNTDDELYTNPNTDPNPEYHYNHQNNRVFVRYPIKNFPWIPLEQAKDLDRSELDEIIYDMCGALGQEDINYEILRKVQRTGPISSGRHLLRACKEATELLLHDPNNWWNYAVALELAGKPDQAFESYKKAIELTPTNPKIWFFFGNAYLRSNYQEEAYETFKIAISYLKNVDFLKMEYNEKEIFSLFYKDLLEAQFEDLIEIFNEAVHSKISLKEIRSLARKEIRYLARKNRKKNI